MSDGKSGEIDEVLRTQQIIIGALATGVLFFLVIVTVFLGARVQPFDTTAMISMVMAAFAVSSLPLRLFVPGLVVRSSCQRIADGTWAAGRRQPHMPVPETDEGKLAAVFVTKTIIGAAILEGGAFANLIAFMLEGQVYSLVLAVLFMFGILLAFPTRNGLSEWLDTQLRRLQEVRGMRG